MPTVGISLGGPINPAIANAANNYVAVPAAADTPGEIGQRALDPATGRTIFYTGDGASNHSWGYNELVAYPPTSEQ